MVYRASFPSTCTTVTSRFKRYRAIFFVLLFFVPVGNFQIRTASVWTGGLEPPDFVVTDMQRVSARRCHVFLATSIGVFECGLDSAETYERPRAPGV